MLKSICTPWDSKLGEWSGTTQGRSVSFFRPGLDSSPQHISIDPDVFLYALTTGGGRIGIASGKTVHIWDPQSGLRQLPLPNPPRTQYDCYFFCMGEDFLAYRRVSGATDRYYWSFASVPQAEFLLFSLPGLSRAAQADGPAIVCQTNFPDVGQRIVFAYLNRADPYISDSTVVLEPEELVERTPAKLSVTILNAMPRFPVTEPSRFLLTAFFTNPNGVILSEATKEVTGALSGPAGLTATFDDVILPREGTALLKVRLDSLSFTENPINNLVVRELHILDSDPEPPIFKFEITEAVGDGDNVIGADESIRFSWSFHDRHSRLLVADVTIVDAQTGIPVFQSGDVQGTSILGPLDAGTYDLLAEAFDDDLDSPGEMHLKHQLEVVEPERLEILYQGSEAETSLYLGRFRTGQSADVDIELRNSGEQKLTVYNIVSETLCSGPEFTPLALKPGESTKLPLCLDVQTPGQRAADLFIRNSSPEDKVTINISWDVAAEGTLPGDCNTDGDVDISDAICMLEYLFVTNIRQLPCEDKRGNVRLLDANADEALDISDATFLLRYLFADGPAPAFGKDCLWLEGCQEVCATR